MATPLATCSLRNSTRPPSSFAELEKRVLHWVERPFSVVLLFTSATIHSFIHSFRLGAGAELHQRLAARLHSWRYRQRQWRMQQAKRDAFARPIGQTTKQHKRNREARRTGTPLKHYSALAEHTDIHAVTGFRWLLPYTFTRCSGKVFVSWSCSPSVARSHLESKLLYFSYFSPALQYVDSWMKKSSLSDGETQRAREASSRNPECHVIFFSSEPTISSRKWRSITWRESHRITPAPQP